MNQLIRNEYFHIILNQFLAIDKDLIPWKLTCKYTYYYIYDIYVNDVNILGEIIKYINPISINTYKYIYSLPTLGRKLCKCGLNMRLTNVFDFKKFNTLHNLKELHLCYSPITDKHISYLKNLEFLDLGMHSHVTDKGLKKLTNLKILYLRNNWEVTKEIFKYLTKLHTLQIGYETYSDKYCSVKPDEIPKTINRVICSKYEDIECPYNVECDPLYCIEVSSKIIR